MVPNHPLWIRLLLRAAFIRNFLAIADFLPGFHLLGAILILTTAMKEPRYIRRLAKIKDLEG